MTALAADRNTHSREGQLASYPVKAGAVIYKGAIVVIDSSGFAVPASTATGLVGPGRAEEAVDNTGGANGDVNVTVRKDRWHNYVDAADTTAMDRTQIGSDVYATDDQTITLTTTGRSKVGVLRDFDADGPWIEFV